MKKENEVKNPCEYCTHYHMYSHERIDDCCMGQSDPKRDFFTCNEHKKND